ncbi:MAG: phosphate acyltransferase PlsX [Mycoplasmoidaceae bacterium]
MIKIAFDVMGFENDLAHAINAARKFVKKYSDTKIIIVGQEALIKSHFNSQDEFEVQNASEVINQEDTPLVATRKKDSSMLVAMKMVQEGKADAVLSPGSTPSFVSLSFLTFGLIKNISKPAFTPTFPSANRKGFIMLDVGCNKVNTAEELVQFAIMGDLYAKHVRQINSPSVKLLNIGTEEYKGLDNIVEANKLLQNRQGINYQGFIEPNTLLLGETDVIIADGFTGNICLKSMEGAMKVLSNEFKKNFKKPSGWLGGLFGYFTFKKVKEAFNYKNFAGALVMGLNKIAIKAHGSADEQEFLSALALARNSVENNIIGKIRDAMDEKK